MTRASPLPMFVVLAIYARLGPSAALSALFAVALLVPQLVRGRVRLAAVSELVVSLLLFGIGLALLVTFLPRAPAAIEQLPTPWAGLAGALLVVAIARGFLASPLGGEPATLGLGMLALMACGGVASGALYPVSVALFLVTALFARRAAAKSSAPLVELVRGHGFVLAAMGLVVAGTSFGLVRALPDAHGWAMQQILAGRPPAVGVGGRLWLGSMRGLLDSPTAVMRVHGDVELLRGLAFSRYDLGRWSRDESRIVALSTPTALVGPDVVTVEWLDGDPRRYFVPLEAGEVALSSGFGRVDPLGNLDPVDAHPAARLSFRRGGSKSAPVEGPTPEDVRVPTKIAGLLRDLARRVAAEARDDEARLGALEAHLLREYRYSLDFERSPYGDPVVEFLTRSREGHCEYFASAFALLARSLGIPARVVVGYRVLERNPLSGDRIVRERDAHAWVEAWIGEWKTFDPTPHGEGALLSARTTPLPLAVLDGLGALGARFLVWLDGLTLVEALVAPTLSILGFAAFRWRRSRGGVKRSRRAREPGPPPSFEALVQGLAAHGLSFGPADTIEDLARRTRLAGLAGTLGEQCAAALERYAAARYGAEGDVHSVARELEALSLELGIGGLARRASS